MKEIWKIISKFKDYRVSNLGRIKSLKFDKELILKGRISNGYRQVALSVNGYKYTVKVARLVLFTFIGPCPKGMEASHLNDNRSDDRLENLVWESHIENMNRRTEYNTDRKGEKNGRAKLKNKDVVEIRKLLKQRLTNTAIAKRFNVSQPIISGIKLNKIWSYA